MKIRFGLNVAPQADRINADMTLFGNIIPWIAIASIPILAQTDRKIDPVIRAKAEAYLLLLSVVVASLFLMFGMITFVRMMRARRDREQQSRSPRKDSYQDIWGSYRLREQDLEFMDDLKNSGNDGLDDLDDTGYHDENDSCPPC